MAKRRTPLKRKQPRADWLENPDLIIFAGEDELRPGAIEQHGLTEWAGNLFGRKKEEVKADWETVLSQMRYLLDRVSTAAKDYELSEVDFQLGFSAEGKIVFVAKAGITTTISAKFARKKTV